MQNKDVLNEVMGGTKRNRAEEIKNIFSQRLKELRQEKQLSQKDVANKLCVAVSTYANWEQGRTEPGIYDIFNLIRVFDIEANDLFAMDI